MSSPTKSQAPSLRQPGAGHSYLFSQRPPSPEKPLPSIPARNPSFTTPRKIEIDFSSGGETPNTPDNQADSDATQTPETTDRTNSKNSSRSDILKEGRRESFTARFFKSLKASPGRGEIPRDVYTKKGERKVHKRRARGPERRDHKRRYSVSDSEDDEDDRRHRGGKSRSQGQDQQAPQPPQSTIASILTFIHGHPDLPHIFSYYLQTILNAFYCLCIIYFISAFWSAIKSDVEKEIEKAAGEIWVEVNMCAQQYRENKCERETRVPAMEKACANWETCMNRDPSGVGRAKVSAHTFALIFNSFIEAISWKAMVCPATFSFPFNYLSFANLRYLGLHMFDDIRRHHSLQRSLHILSKQQNLSRRVLAAARTATHAPTPS